MAISINSKMSGFRKWAETHEPAKIDKADSRANEDGIDAVADDLLVGTLDQQPHRPWLVPGTGKL
jgi:hypothetical protein